jgi:hypothetical protein
MPVSKRLFGPTRMAGIAIFCIALMSSSVLAAGRTKHPVPNAHPRLLGPFLLLGGQNILCRMRIRAC